VMRIEEMSRAERASRSISTLRVRASDQDFMGGSRGMVCVLPSVVLNVMEERDMEESVAP